MRFLWKALRSSIRSNVCLISGLLFGALLSVLVNNVSFSEKGCTSLTLTWDNDDLEPVINLAGKPLRAQKQPQELIRPRYYSTELGIKEKIFVGILSSPMTLKFSAKALNDTLHPLVNKLVVFLQSDKSIGELPMTGVVTFGDTRSILKPFHALKYIADNYLDEFEFFFLVKDSVYVRGYKLRDLLRNISVAEEVHFGVVTTDPFVSFCSLESGLLISGNILRRVAQHLDWCVQNAFSESDDANIGRCIVHATNHVCSNAFGQFTSFRVQSNKLDLPRLIKQPSFNDALTVGPLTRLEQFYLIHNQSIETELGKINKIIHSLAEKLSNSTVILPNNKTELMPWPVSTSHGNKPVNRFDLLRWDFFTESDIYLKNDYTVVDSLSGVDFLDIQTIMNEVKKFIKTKYGNRFEFKRLLNGYRKFDPSRGMDYILDLGLNEKISQHEVHKRFEVCKPLGQVELVPVPYVTEANRVHLIVLVTSETRNEIHTFLDSYASVCMAKKDRTFLLLVLLYGADHPGKGAKDDVFAEIKAHAQKLTQRFRRDNNRVGWLSVKLPRSLNTKFINSNGLLKILLTDLIVRKFTPDNLLLFSTSNVELKQDFLNRVRMNTIKGVQLFSPIPFTEYHPDIIYSEELHRPKDLDINKNYGHYDILDFDHISFYVSDYKLARERLEKILPTATADRDLSPSLPTPNSNLTILSESSLYGLFVRYGDSIRIFRGVDPSLRLRHVEYSCPLSVREDVCLRRKYANLGPRTTLGKMVLDRKLNSIF